MISVSRRVSIPQTFETITFNQLKREFNDES